MPPFFYICNENASTNHGFFSTLLTRMGAIPAAWLRVSRPRKLHGRDSGSVATGFAPKWSTAQV